MISAKRLKGLRNSIFNRPRSPKAKTIVLGLKESIELIDTCEVALKVVAAAQPIIFWHRHTNDEIRLPRSLGEQLIKALASFDEEKE